MPFIPDNDQERVQLLLELRKENKQTLEKLFATVSEGEHTKVIRAETEGCYIRMEIMLNDQFEIRYYRDDVEVIPEVEETGSNLAELSVFKKLGPQL
jgi:hypothetical protein